MVATSEQNPLVNPNQLSPEQSDAVLAIGHIGLSGVEISAGHFYGGDEQFIGRTPDGEH